MDLESGRSWRALDGSPTTQVDKRVTVTLDGQPLRRPDGRQPTFAEARVHVMAREREAAEHERRGFLARRRYRPAQFDEVRDWRTYAAGGEPWFGFDAVRQLDGLPPEILMVPLPGHTWGHAGVAIDTGAGWILNAGDAYFFRHEMNVDRPRCSPGLAAYQALMEVDRERRLLNQHCLRDLKRARSDRVRIFCSHDVVEFENARGAAGL